MAAMNYTLEFTSPAVNHMPFHLNYTMPANPEDLNDKDSCLACILGGGRFDAKQNKFYEGI